ncbi:MAG: trypsin-like peptidase domain-containing protein [Thermoguttaceae bacterium]
MLHKMPKYVVFFISCITTLLLNHLVAAQTPVQNPVQGTVSNAAQTAVSASVPTTVPTPELRLLEFGSPQCPVCRQIQPVLDLFIQKKYPIQYVDVTTNRQIADRYRVKELPTFVLVYGEDELDRFVGGKDEQTLCREITGIFERGQERLMQQLNTGTSTGTPKNASVPLSDSSRLSDPNRLSDQTRLSSPNNLSDSNRFADPTPSSSKGTVSSSYVGSDSSTLPSSPNLPVSPQSVTQTSAVVPAYSRAISQDHQGIPLNGSNLMSSSTTQQSEPIKRGPVAWVDSTVRLRIEDKNGVNWGTGTIIDTRRDQALILTCGHIFRDSIGEGPVEVHLFNSQDGTPIKVLGTLEDWDLNTDIGFVKILPPCPVRAVPLAPVDSLQVNQKVFSVGCNGGANPTLLEHQVRSLPTIMEHQILSLNRFSPPMKEGTVPPFHYIHVSGAPTQGRSGGGLFSEEGYLVGVCNMGDPGTNDGQFVPLSEVRRMLDSMQLSFVYQTPSLIDSNQTISSSRTLDSPIVLTRSWENGTEPLSNLNGTESSRNEPFRRPSTLSEEEVATWEEIQKRRKEGAEIIVIINSPRQGNQLPQSDVIRLNAVSDQFLDQLTGKTTDIQQRALLTEQAAKSVPVGMQQNFQQTDSRRHETGARELR